MSTSDPSYPSSIGTVSADQITVLGEDVAANLMGKVSFGELAYWLAAQRRPTPGQLRVFEAVLVSLADHGLTPSVIAARLTLTGAPESVQGAIAAGVLGGGSRFLGVTEDSAAFLHNRLALAGELPVDDAGWDELARDAIRARRAEGLLVPGLGHHVHKNGDPRTPVLFQIATDAGVFGPHLQLFSAIGRVAPEELGRQLPLNGAGACGAALADIDLPIEILRGFAILARTAGLVGHLAEEMRQPIGMDVFLHVEENIDYTAPSV